MAVGISDCFSNAKTTDVATAFIEPISPLTYATARHSRTDLQLDYTLSDSNATAAQMRSGKHASTSFANTLSPGAQTLPHNANTNPLLIA